MTPQRRMQLRLTAQNALFVLLLVALTALIVQLGHKYRVEWDVSATGRNSLSGVSEEFVRKLEGPVHVTAYATEQDPRMGEVRSLIRDFVGRYQRVKPDLTLTFVDPREQPKQAEQAGVQGNGELVIGYGERSERLANLSEVEFTNALIRLARSDQRLVMWLEGHGERSLVGRANHDLGDFGSQLRSKGLKINSLNLAIAPEVPDNAALLVVAGPRVDLADAEVDKLGRFLDRGGNLLWLLDQEPLHGLEPLAERLGLVLSPGVVVDPDAVERGGRPLMTVAAPGAYSPHPIVQTFRLNTLFPFARAIGFSPGEEWRSTSLIEAAARGWIETGDLTGPIVYDAGADTPGPATIAVAFERLREEKTQRVVVVGSGHFLANTYLGNGGNLDLGLNIVNWLAGDDRLIAIQPRRAADASLTLSRTWLTTLVVVFLIALPLAFAATGALVWWRRRSA